MTYAPPLDQVDRGARALAGAKGLVWERMPKDWQTELRRQAITVLVAAHGGAVAVQAAPVKPRHAPGALVALDPGQAPDQIDLEAAIAAAPSEGP